ncbi:HNH endonuclease [Marinobacter sp. CA1]|uniref:HNH endonuclease n=1 Tax=Marinobacter sp. CA1 TaxID=2817656 RepID=UPI001D061139|nr:HNH endonuclease signature motif containing protein [Marinobacter sp. CA1]UDL03998.1 HNH endonuclease [Marinobacter sp. CA1]
MRARNIKPGFWKNEDLVDLAFEHRLLFIGLWMLADREGRLEDRPKRIKMELFPGDDVEIDSGLSALADMGLIKRYEVDGKKYVQVENFVKHQMPHHKEVASKIPPPEGTKAVSRHAYDVSKGLREAIFERDGGQCLKCGANEGLSLDHIKPLADGGTNEECNLQTLCKSCNSSKGRATKDYRKTVVGKTSNQQKPNVEPTLNKQRINEGARCPSDSLNPDSLNPESINTLGTSASDAPTQTDSANADGPEKKPPYPQEFELAWGKYPKRPGSNPKRQAFKAWKARTKEGHDPAQILAGVVRYAKFCQGTGKTNTEFVMQAQRFFGPSCEFESEWSPPEPFPDRPRHSGFSEIDYSQGLKQEVPDGVANF